MGTNGLPIDDAMATLVYSGDLPEEEQELSRTALLEMLRKHGFDGQGGFRDLAGPSTGGAYRQAATGACRWRSCAWRSRKIGLCQRCGSISRSGTR